MYAVWVNLVIISGAMPSLPAAFPSFIFYVARASQRHQPNKTNSETPKYLSPTNWIYYKSRVDTPRYKSESTDPLPTQESRIFQRKGTSPR